MSAFIFQRFDTWTCVSDILKPIYFPSIEIIILVCNNVIKFLKFAIHSHDDKMADDEWNFPAFHKAKQLLIRWTQFSITNFRHKALRLQSDSVSSCPLVILSNCLLELKKSFIQLAKQDQFNIHSEKREYWLTTSGNRKSTPILYMHVTVLEPYDKYKNKRKGANKTIISLTLQLRVS